MSSFPDLNPMWGVSKQEQAEEAPQRMEGGVVLNDFYKDIENLVNKNKIDNEFTIRKQRIHDGVPHHDKNEWFDLPHNDEVPPDDNQWHMFTGGFWDPHHNEFLYEIEKRGLDSEINYKFINYLKTGDCADIMEANQISIHVSSGNIYVGDLKTGETGDIIFDFLENQIDETKKLILTVLRFKSSVTEFVDKFLVSMDTKEQWELDVAVNKYSTFLVACYNRSYHTLNGENPILLRQQIYHGRFHD